MLHCAMSITNLRLCKLLPKQFEIIWKKIKNKINALHCIFKHAQCTTQRKVVKKQ